MTRNRLVALIGLLMVAAFAVVFIIGGRLSAPVLRSVGEAPADLGAEAVAFRSESGAEVKGWWCPAQASGGTILLLAGIRANRLTMVGRARFLRHAGYSVLLIDLQGTGETTGRHITFGWKESRDVLAAVDFIRQRQPSDHIGILGSSLGGAAALLAAPTLRIDALVLEAVYPTVELATRNRLEKYLSPFGRSLAPLLLSQLRPRVGISAAELWPVDHIEKIACPLFLISGEKDRHTRPADTLMLFNRAPHPKNLWLVPNAAHVDLHRFGGAEYETRVLAFFGENLE